MALDNLLQAASCSIAWNILVQILSRGFTFILGAITLKYLQSSALLGIINVRLALLYTTLQFLSREPFRRACLSAVANCDRKALGRIVNTIWLGSILAIAFAVPLCIIWQYNCPSPNDLQGTTTSDYYRAVLIVCFAVIIEMISEPVFIYAQAKAITDHNPKIEMFSVFLKSTLIASVTVLESGRYKAGQSSGILTKITLCQLITSLLSVVYSYGRLCTSQELPITIFLPSFGRKLHLQNNQHSSDILDKNCLKLSLSFFSQTCLKQLLTEGERYVMTFFNIISLSEQGIYDVVNNLGSLAARLVFKPIEESGYTLFSQTVSRTEILDIRKFYQVQENLMFLIKSMLLLGLMIPVFGYNFVPLIVLYGGEKLNNDLAFNLMKWQLFYTPLLALNGITECFTFATMNTPEIRTYNIHLVQFSLIFLLTIYLTQTSLGCASFILANCLIMLLRITISYQTIGAYFKKHGYQLHILDAIPSLTTFISLSGVFTFLSASQYYLLDMNQPVSIVFGLILSVWCLLFIILVVGRHEEALLNFASKKFQLKLK